MTEFLVLETDNGIEDNTTQLLVNHWDIGEGRLRPRRISKTYSQSVAKVKCSICNKFFRETYIEVSCQSFIFIFSIKEKC